MLEGLEIILKLWKEDKATYNGKYYKIYNAPFGRKLYKNLIHQFGLVELQKLYLKLL